MEQYLEVLRRHQLRATKPRKAVFMLLRQTAKPLDIAAITTSLPEIDRVTVYRTLELFIRVGIVTVVPIGWKRRYELADPFVPHRHHIVCVRCGASRDIQSPVLEGALHQVIQDTGYSELGHSVEITGYCPGCRSLKLALLHGEC